jgi:hypothetical protein
MSHIVQPHRLPFNIISPSLAHFTQHTQKIASSFRKGHCAFLTFPESLPTKVSASDVYTLDFETKVRLLASSVPFSEPYKQTARNILEHLRALSQESLNDVFKLKSDDINHVPFRLVNPGWNSTMPHDSYVTASYCWSHPEEENLEFLLNPDHKDVPMQPDRLPVSPLLFQALLKERSSPLEGVWIDQLCINQDSLEEKQIAVNAMDLVYRSARIVIILLEDIKITIEEQEFLASYIVDFERFDDGK